MYHKAPPVHASKLPCYNPRAMGSPLPAAVDSDAEGRATSLVVAIQSAAGRESAECSNPQPSAEVKVFRGLLLTVRD